MSKEPASTLESETQASQGKIAIQQFDFKAYFRFFPYKRLSEKLPKSLQSPILSSFRTPLQSSLASVRRRALTRIETLDYLAIKSRTEPDRGVKLDFPKSVKLIKDLSMRKLLSDVEKTTARGGGFTTFGHVYQCTPKRVPFLVSKREAGRIAKHQSKVMLSLNIPRRNELSRPTL